MCGIAGIVHADRDRPVDRWLLERMAATLVHRGPDAHGLHVGRGIGLASRRLNVIDISGGAQPMANEEGTVRVVLNGEIYNFRTLRTELEARGHVFRTRSDTEVLVHGWDAWGEACVERFNGMFALAVWDARTQTLFLARDRIGKKPLYYWPAPDGLVFASELKALLRSPALEPAVDAEALDLYLTFGAVPPPRTIVRGVRQLPAAHWLRYRRGAVEVREYWDAPLRAPITPRPENEYLEEFRALLDDAVRLRLVSDVPVGAFLSGGIDSTAVVEAMTRQSAGRVITTTVGFRERSLDEREAARATASMLGSDHHEAVVDAAAADVMSKLAWHLDEPFADSSALPTYYVCRAARDHVTVALSGDGGDELFAGYARRYRLARTEAAIRARVGPWARREIVAPLGRLYPKRDWLPRPLRLKYVLENVAVSLPEAYLFDRSLFRPREKVALLVPASGAPRGERLGLEVNAPFFDRVREQDALSQILYVDFKTYLVNDILTKVDRMSMAVSLEVRCPLLDHRIVELASRMPLQLKLRGRSTKHLLRRHLDGRVPAAVLRRPKSGFAVPLAPWLRAELQPLLHDVLFARRATERGYFDPAAVRGLVSLHLSGARDYSAQLWALLMLELWHRTFADRSRVAVEGVS